MITKKSQTKALELLNEAQSLLNNDDTDEDILCCIGGLVEDVYDMETVN
jgi:hypothetical protein